MRSAALLALVLGALGFLPLCGGPRYEAALLAGLLAPSWTALVTALSVSARVRKARLAPGTAICLDALRTALGHCVAIFLVATLHGLRAGFCEPGPGYLLLLLGPGVGILLGAMWGASVGVAFAGFQAERPLASRVVCCAAALAGPALTAAWGLVEFYCGPSVYAFDPFVGYFAGPLYDSIPFDSARLALFRLGSALTAIGWLLAATSVTFKYGAQSWPVASLSPGFRLSVAGVLFLLSCGHASLATRMGLATTNSSIERALPGRAFAGSCQVLYSEWVAESDARRVAEECRAHVAQLRSFFDLRGTGAPVRVLLFANSEEKGRMMGAKRTFIAKPWRREVYVQNEAFPHPVLAHELAHVMTSEFGRGPFGVAGSFGGLVPDPGRIEGFAVAAAPAEQGDATEEEWSSAMLELNLLPPTRSLFSLGFLGSSAVRMYTASGAYVRYLHGHFGAQLLKDWYGGAELERLTKRSWAQLNEGYRAELRSRPASARIRALAQEVFNRPAVWGRRCPHEADRALERAQALCTSDPGEVGGALQRVLELDGTRQDARVLEPGCLAADGRVSDAQALAKTLSQAPEISERAKVVTRSTDADLDWVEGRVDLARAAYRALRGAALTLPEWRAVEVKLWAQEQPPVVARRIKRLLAVGGAPPSAEALRVEELESWYFAGPEKPMAAYLLGLQLAEHAPARSVELFHQALSGQLAHPELRVEALRRLLLLGCATQNPALLREGRDGLLRESRSMLLRRMAERQAQRCGLPLSDDEPLSTPGAVRENAVLPTKAACALPLLPIPGGSFWVGSERPTFDGEENPRFRTRLPDFCADAREVSATEYETCVNYGKCAGVSSDNKTCNASRKGRGAHPMNCISFAEAQAVCAFRGARLPTEVEWEYLARGGALMRSYPWGEESPEGRACWKSHQSCAVGSFPEGAFGLFDVVGNVWEWTSSWFAPYPWPALEGRHRVYRGGGWSRRFDKWMSPTLRNRVAPESVGSHLGVRCVADQTGADCPYGRDEASGHCRFGVDEVKCLDASVWNGARCVRAGEQEKCPQGSAELSGRGCSVAPLSTAGRTELDTSAVARARSPEFDGDCQTNQALRPTAYRFTGGQHLARNAVGQALGCKNRDVGVGWNSACCP